MLPAQQPLGLQLTSVESELLEEEGKCQESVASGERAKQPSTRTHVGFISFRILQSISIGAIPIIACEKDKGASGRCIGETVKKRHSYAVSDILIGATKG